MRATPTSSANSSTTPPAAETADQTSTQGVGKVAMNGLRVGDTPVWAGSGAGMAPVLVRV